MLAVNHLVLLAATALLAVELWLKFSSPTRLVTDNTIIVINVCMGSVSLAAVLGVGALFMARIWSATRAGKRWLHRRRRTVALFAAELVVQGVNLCFFVAANGLVLARPCSWFTTPSAVLGQLQFTCWTTVSLVQPTLVLTPCRQVAWRKLDDGEQGYISYRHGAQGM